MRKSDVKLFEKRQSVKSFFLNQRTIYTCTVTLYNDVSFTNYPGQKGYIGSCRTGIKSVATRKIGSDRLLFAGFRCDPLFSFDIRWSDSSSFDQIHTFGTDQIRFQEPIISNRIQDNPASRNRRYLWVHMTQDFRIKPFNHCYRNLSDHVWM